MEYCDFSCFVVQWGTNMITTTIIITIILRILGMTTVTQERNQDIEGEKVTICWTETSIWTFFKLMPDQNDNEKGTAISRV